MQKKNIELIKQREKDLLEQLEVSPNDLDLLNEIAIFYSQNIAIGLTPDYQDIQYFEKAYKAKKTIKSMNNLAFYKYFQDRAGEDATDFDDLIKIQKECIAYNPKSCIPYEVYAYFMLEKGNYKEASKYYHLAVKKGADSYDVFHNLGITYFHQNNFLEASKYLEYSLIRVNKKESGQFNLAIIYLSMGKTNKSICLLRSLEKLIDKPSNKHSACIDYNYLDLSVLYFFLEDYKKSSELARKSDYNFNFIDYKEVAFSLYVENMTIYKEKIEKFIAEERDTIAEVKANIEEWEDETALEKELAINEAIENISQYQKMTTDFKNSPPKIELSQYLLETPCRCLLFGCKTHGNSEND